VLAVLVAGYALFTYGTQPLGARVHPQMRAEFEARPVAIYAHIFGASVALLLGPLQFLKGLRAARPGLHRALGWAYLALGVGVGGLAGLYVAFFAFGGAVSTSGFAVLAVVWLYTGARAVLAAKRRDFDTHRRWMVRNFALALAAVTLRIGLGIGFGSGLPFEVFYPPLAWLSWVPNLLLAELLLWRER
jgi:uncharacterized membrane protein